MLDCPIHLVHTARNIIEFRECEAIMRLPVLPATLFVLAMATFASAEGIPAITKPSQDVTLSFSRPGLVIDVPVKEGEVVKKGQLIARQDDREELAALESDKYKALDTTKISAQQAILDQKKVDFDKIKATGVSTRFEVDNAKLEVTIAEANLKMAVFEHEQDGRKYEQSKAAVDRLRLNSPVDGVVETLMVKSGEGVDQQTKVMRIVNIDPLWVEAPVKLVQAKQLKLEQAAAVTFSDQTTRTGRIIHIASVADAASDTLLVRVEVKNPVKTPAGERVTVEFSKPAAANTAPAAAQPRLTANAQDAAKPQSHPSDSSTQQESSQ